MKFKIFSLINTVFLLAAVFTGCRIDTSNPGGGSPTSPPLTTATPLPQGTSVRLPSGTSTPLPGIVYVDANLDVPLDFLQDSIWLNAGYPGEIPGLSGPVIEISPGDTRDAIQAAITGAPNPAVIHFPAGTYTLNGGLTLHSGIVLRGEGSNQTILHFDTDQNCITLSGSDSGSPVSVTGGLEMGSTELLVSDASQFEVGQGLRFYQDDFVYDPAVNADWGRNAPGQIAKVQAINGNTLTIDPPLNLAYSVDMHPLAQPLHFIRDVGIEYLRIERPVTTDAASSVNINIGRAADCWIRGIESDFTTQHHVAASRSLHLEIRDSYFHDAQSLGDGGAGYGVSLAVQATAILVENNIFYNLRHSMIIQIGVNGTVFGYNYSERNWSDNDNTDKPAISLHGHFLFFNLFEGNITAWAYMGDFWGDIGPGNTLFRNRLLGSDGNQEFGDREGIGVRYFYGTQYIIGNEVNGEGIYYFNADNRKVFDLPGDILVHGNNVKGTVTWDAELSHDLPDSYYLTTKPAFFGSLNLPALGGDLTFGQGTIPALQRWDAGPGDCVPQP